jgi:hypothetical protein
MVTGSKSAPSILLGCKQGKLGFTQQITKGQTSFAESYDQNYHDLSTDLYYSLDPAFYNAQGN